MNKENYLTWFVPLDIAKELKDIGFKEPCLFSYSEGVGITAMVWGSLEGKTEFSIKDFVLSGNSPGSPFTDIPTYEQVFEWFRERGLFSYIRPNIGAMDWYSYRIYDRCNFEKGRGMSFYYEDARLFCMEALIEIFKEQQRNKEKRTM
jgi:hypothetical protein